MTRHSSGQAHAKFILQDVFSADKIYHVPLFAEGVDMGQGLKDQTFAFQEYNIPLTGFMEMKHLTVTDIWEAADTIKWLANTLTRTYIFK